VTAGKIIPVLTAVLQTPAIDLAIPVRIQAMISYPLARKLKDAGFPQSELARAQHKAGYDYVSLPSLSTLIEACGSNFGALAREVDCWLACGYISEYGEWKNAHAGDTPEDAVARLWLSIHGSERKTGISDAA